MTGAQTADCDPVKYYTVFDRKRRPIATITLHIHDGSWELFGEVSKKDEECLRRLLMERKIDPAKRIFGSYEEYLP